MMKRSDISRWTRAEPFRPYRIVCRNGRSFSIHDWYSVMPMADAVMITVHHSSRLEDDELVEIPMYELDRIEPIEGAQEIHFPKFHATAVS
jgi:hypothetical protein